MEHSTVRIPDDVILPIVEAKIAEAVTASMDGKDAIIQRIVSEILNAKVDKDGEYERYSSRDHMTWIQWLMKDCMKKAVKEALMTNINKYQDQIRDQIVHDLSKNKSKLAKSLATSMIEGSISEHNLKYNFKMEIIESENY